MADLYAKIIGTASNYLYSYVLIILLVGGGIYFTIRTKGYSFVTYLNPSGLSWSHPTRKMSLFPPFRH